MSVTKLKRGARKLGLLLGDLSAELVADFAPKLLFALAFSAIGGGIVALTSEISYLMAFVVIFVILVLGYLLYRFDFLDF